MALSNSQYDTIIRSYEEKQNRNKRLSEERIRYIYSHVEGYRELDESVASISVEHGKKLLEGNDDALLELKAILMNLTSMKNELLISSGFSPEYLQPIYDCSDCKDTGYINGVKCHCFKQAEIALLYEQSGIRKVLENDNFNHLSYEYYEGEDLLRFKNAAAASKDFIETFNSVYRNLFFYGTVGTGKSFLSGCIAKELIESGHSVIYFSAAGLFELLSKNLFQYKNKEEPHNTNEDLYRCDLLIIDDLGTEFTNDFVATQLFSLLNERHMNKKATIISTNLTLDELSSLYSDRIFSRITSNYELCKLTGQDIRMYKKRQQNRK